MIYYKLKQLKQVFQSIIWLILFYKHFKKTLFDRGITKIKFLKFKKWHNGSKYFTGILKKNGEKLFIKTGNRWGILKREKNILEIINEHNSLINVNFPRIIDSYFGKKMSFLILNFFDLDFLNFNNQLKYISKKDFDFLSNKFYLISSFFNKIGLFHRDIRPENILVDKNITNLAVIDFAFSICPVKNFNELLIKDKSTLNQLGGEYRYSKNSWDDSYSFYKILKGLNNKFSNTYLEKIGNNLGKNSYTIVGD
jgi:serine/threonine protein kinase